MREKKILTRAMTSDRLLLGPEKLIRHGETPYPGYPLTGLVGDSAKEWAGCVGAGLLRAWGRRVEAIN